MARRRFEQGSSFLRGKRQRVWVARGREGSIKPDDKLGRSRRAEGIGTLAALPARRKARQVISERQSRRLQNRFLDPNGLQVSETCGSDGIPIV